MVVDSEKRSANQKVPLDWSSQGMFVEEVRPEQGHERQVGFDGVQVETWSRRPG